MMRASKHKRIDKRSVECWGQKEGKGGFGSEMETYGKVNKVVYVRVRRVVERTKRIKLSGKKSTGQDDGASIYTNSMYGVLLHRSMNQ